MVLCSRGGGGGGGGRVVVVVVGVVLAKGSATDRLVLGGFPLGSACPSFG